MLANSRVANHALNSENHSRPYGTDLQVFNDLGIYWDILELGHHSPDIAVIFGIRRARRIF